MLTHIVFIRFTSIEIVDEARQKLLSMEGKIPSLRSIEVGVDITRSKRSWDLALVTRFEDQAGLDAYGVHPVHKKVQGFLRSHATSVAAVDYLEN